MTKYERGETILIIVLESVLVIAKNWKKLRGVLRKKVSRDIQSYLLGHLSLLTLPTIL